VGALLFNAGCNKEVLFLNPEKKFGENLSCRFREKLKNAQFNSEKWRHRAEGWLL